MCELKPQTFLCQKCNKTFQKKWMLARHHKKVDCPNSINHNCIYCECNFRHLLVLRKQVQDKHHKELGFNFDVEEMAYGSNEETGVENNKKFRSMYETEEMGRDTLNMIYVDDDNDEETEIHFTAVIGGASNYFPTFEEEEEEEESDQPQMEQAVQMVGKKIVLLNIVTLH